ncbi:ABC transporter family protein [Tanacetum coccineum]
MKLLQSLYFLMLPSYVHLQQLLISSRNLEFFTSGYRYLIQILPAAVVAPMYFSGKIEFCVINQSISAFNHILGDFSLIVHQFQAINAFSAVIDRLGEFDDVLDYTSSKALMEAVDEIQIPINKALLIRDLSLEVCINEHLLVVGPSGSGKTCLLRTIGGLWCTCKGKITFYAKYTSVQNQPRTPDLGCTKTPPRCHMTFSKRGETGKPGETPGKRPQEKRKPPDVAPHEAEMVVKKNNLDKISKYRDFKESTPHNSKATVFRVIGPAMPTPELLAAAAKLTEIGAELREAKVGDDVLSIGSPPPTIVNETASANDAECFEEVLNCFAFNLIF